ncbi:divalent-cation tolerance protein CutA [Roseateles asaccharophilus]|uniref:Periplasmic divalent cation tolerance protein n=1 Tax=Roseateles asaccharophilus TaxID=582607 RepID=A0ABU2AFQ3_9BURK|nr:divalent-cation tolerance protein CutA [Roseateles asaccharophilus]MDR7335905.1 periplasmic divalent cation tolerance protein [Roseateles asaccharophilus]
MDLLAVHTSVARQDQANALARAAVEQGLAACVQTEAIRSTYRWQGEVVCEDEVRLMFKTTRALYPALEALLRELHPYELPAIYALPVIAGTTEYAEWVRSSLRQPDQA